MSVGGEKKDTGEDGDIKRAGCGERSVARSEVGARRCMERNEERRRGGMIDTREREGGGKGDTRRRQRGSHATRQRGSGPSTLRPFLLRRTRWPRWVRMSISLSDCSKILTRPVAKIGDDQDLRSGSPLRGRESRSSPMRRRPPQT